MYSFDTCRFWYDESQSLTLTLFFFSITDIIRERSEVILNWMEVAKTISEEHTDLRRLLFTNMVSKSFPEDESSPLPDDTIITAVDVSEIQKDEEDSASSPTEVFGAFE